MLLALKFAAGLMLSVVVVSNILLLDKRMNENR